MTKKYTVAVGMSGGVDSSVAALLLKKQGYNVFGLFMKNWEESEASHNCLAAKDQEDALSVCKALDIPLYTVNFTEDYYEQVFQDLLKGLQLGLTPNPDILCNREIKFNLLLKKAQNLGADYLATGHYCRISSTDSSHYLLKGLDPNKDQSYFIYTLQEKLLPHLLFPIGDFEKNYVRQLAKEASLSTSEKKDSTGICFIGKRNFQQFIAKYLPVESGPILDTQGRHLGNHVGALYYTIGQRKGLGIGGQGDAWFVVDKDVKNNTLYVAQGAAHPALFSQKLLAHTPSWVNGPPSLLPKKCFAKIRYRQADQECLIENISPENFQVSFIKPQWAITPGQSIVLYEENRCLGGGIISHKF